MSDAPSEEEMEEFANSLPAHLDEESVYILTMTDDPVSLDAHLNMIGHFLVKIGGVYLFHKDESVLVETTKHLAPSIIMIIESDRLGYNTRIAEEQS